MRGNLSPDALARVLRGLAVSRKEGILHLQKDGVSKRIYFRDGAIIFAGSDDEQERLGEVLVRAGKLKRSDLELALRVMKETGERLGKTLVEMGATSPADVSAQALERTKAIIRSAFSWPSGTFLFEERKTEVDEETALELSTAETILDAARSIEDLDLIRRGLGDLKSVLRQPTNPLLPYEGSASSSVDWLLYQANGVSTIEEIVAASPLDEGRTLGSIYALVLAGILEIESPDKAMAARVESTSVNLGAKTTTPAASGPSMASPHTMPKTLGRYEVERVLGRGAMGAVYLATDPTIDRKIAIKLIQTAVQLSPFELEKYRERFYREAKAAGRLLHPGIVTVFDVGHTDDETPFIVMEYVEGRTLQEILNSEKLELREVPPLAIKILEPLAYAHSNGIVHRDIKPANILVTSERGVKVMDFGIAHVVGSELTQADDVLGSPNFMAPEQLSKGRIDARTDLFAFGVVLYRMLTGELPFTGESFAAIAKAILFEEPPPPAGLDPAIPEHLSDVVLRCLAKEPSRRYETANELKEALSSPAVDHRVRDTDKAVSAQASISRGPADSRKRLQPSMKAGGSSPSPLRSTLAKPRYLLGAAGGFGMALLVSFALLRESSTTESVSHELSTTLSEPAPGSGTPSKVGEIFSAAEEAAAGANREERSDADLFHQASVAFERGDLHASKQALEKLLGENPAFEGAPELLVRVNQELRSDEPSAPPENASAPRPAAVRPPAATAPAPAEAQLLYQATVAFERGDLEASKRQLEALLQTNPSLQGASELLVKVNDEIWKKGLPMSFEVKHSHRIGSCSGTLTLAASGIRYSSKDHEWRWDFDEVRLMERNGRWILNLETHETEALSLGKPKNYKFEFATPIPDEDWSRYQRLVR